MGVRKEEGGRITIVTMKYIFVFLDWCLYCISVSMAGYG